LIAISILLTSIKTHLLPFNIDPIDYLHLDKTRTILFSLKLNFDESFRCKYGKL